jgi:hypothetical protein
MLLTGSSTIFGKSIGIQNYKDQETCKYTEIMCLPFFFNYGSTYCVIFFDKNVILLSLLYAPDARYGSDINHFNWVSTTLLLKYEGCDRNTWDLICSHTSPITPRLIVPSSMPYHTVFPSLSTVRWHVKFRAIYEPWSIDKITGLKWSVCMLCYGCYQVWNSW